MKIKVNRKGHIMKATKYISALLITLFLTSMLFAPRGERQLRRHLDDGERLGHHGKVMQLPDLTEQQKEQLKKIRTANMKEILPIRNTVAEKKAHLRSLQSAEKAEMNKINSTIDEISTLKTKIAKLRAENHQKVREILTDDQRIIFDSKPKGKSAHHRMGKGKNGKLWMDQ